MTTPLEGKVALVVGAASGIGRATAELFAARGAIPVLADVSPTVDDVLDELESSTDGRGSAVVVDIADPQACVDAAQRTLDLHGRIDVLAVVAGVNHDAHPLGEFPVAEWNRTLGVNLSGPFHMCRAVVPYMQRQRYGRIVTVGSWWARGGQAYFAAYCASKAGLVVFTQCLADEVAADGITANVVCPGNVNTRMHTDALADEAKQRGISFEEMRDIEWRKIPMGKPAEPIQIAQAIAWLASDEASYITGASLDVNGGVVFH